MNCRHAHPIVKTVLAAIIPASACHAMVNATFKNSYVVKSNDGPQN
jgi:hypothetical protein